MSDEQLNQPGFFAAFFADLAYTSPQERQAKIDSMNFNTSFQIDPDFNDEEFFAVVGGDDLIYGHRGTSNLSDVGTDLGLAVGQFQQTERFKRSKKRSEQVQSKYQGQEYNETHVGHSLGGTLADEISRQLGHQSISFNQGTSPFMKTQESSLEHQQHRTTTDFVSSFAHSNALNHTPSYQPNQGYFASHHNNSFLSKLAPGREFIANTYNSFIGHSLQNFL